MTLLTIVLLVLILVFIALNCYRVFLKSKRAYRPIPGLPAPSLPLLGHAYLLGLPDLNEDNLFERVIWMWGHRTQLFGLQLFWYPFVVVSDPDDIESAVKKTEMQNKAWFFYEFLSRVVPNGLIPLNGPKWRAHRKALEPAFHAVVLDRFVDFFAAESDGFTRRVSCSPKGENVEDNIMRFTAGTFVRTSLVSEVGEREERTISSVIRFMDVALNSMMKRNFLPWLWSDWAFGLTHAARETRGLRDELAGLAKHIISEKRAEQRQRSGARDDFIRQRPTLIDVLVESAMSDEDIVDEVIMFLIAAIETSADTLSWTVKVLSVRQDVQDRLREEAREVLGDAATVTSDLLPRLEYTERVLKETLRLLPTVPALARACAKDTELAGYTVTKDSTILLNLYGAHRDPRHWPDPLCFDPDRFLPERSAGRHPYAFVPFSVGPRNCIGARYAMMAMKTFVASLVSRLRVLPVDDGHTDPACFPVKIGFGTRFVGGVRVVLAPVSATD